jgi:homoserine kinase
MKQVIVRVPATTANIGPGFDCLGAALTLYNQFKFSPAEKNSIKITGSESYGLFLDLSENNLLYQSFLKLYRYIDHFPPAVAMEVEVNIPLARGLGSSATAVVGGLLAANTMAKNPLTLREIRNLAISIEGHPDNVVPALVGNCQLSVGLGGNWQICPIAWHQDIIPVLAIPNFKLSTEKARAVLPQNVSRQDAIFNMAHLGLLLKGLETGNPEYLKNSLQDRLHQPYRRSLIKGYEAVAAAAIEAQAYGLVISGAGPSLLALCSKDTAPEIAMAMGKAWQTVEVDCKILTLELDREGAKILSRSLSSKPLSVEKNWAELSLYLDQKKSVQGRPAHQSDRNSQGRHR